MLAAMACELKVKSTLRESTSGRGRALVNLVIENPREVALQAVALFDKLMHAALGRSLRLEDKKI